MRDTLRQRDGGKRQIHLATPFFLPGLSVPLSPSFPLFPLSPPLSPSHSRVRPPSVSLSLPPPLSLYFFPLSVHHSPPSLRVSLSLSLSRSDSLSLSLSLSFTLSTCLSRSLFFSFLGLARLGSRNMSSFLLCLCIHCTSSTQALNLHLSLSPSLPLFPPLSLHVCVFAYLFVCLSV